MKRLASPSRKRGKFRVRPLREMVLSVRWTKTEFGLQPAGVKGHSEHGRSKARVEEDGAALR